ncbi:hypothetical protein EDC01DRAFT_168036 [Geopyxis carbonaria]|nr:hypothetical protein EDC01DRAFT_168036 [Geopyxis carbonaria]
MDIDASLLSEFDEGPVAVPTSAQDVKDLTRFWIAERNAPDILPYQDAILERLMERVRQQIEMVENETGNLDPTSNFRLILIQTELERVKYLVRAYLRIRMYKIDKFTLHIIDKEQPHLRALLSPSELRYLRQHLTLLNNHYHTSFLRTFPESLRRLDDGTVGTSAGMVDRPDEESAVFCRVLRDVPETVKVEGTDADFDMRKGDIFIVRYSAIKEFMRRGDVELI